MAKRTLSIKLHSNDPEIVSYYEKLEQSEHANGHEGDSGINIIFPHSIEIPPCAELVTFIPLGVSTKLESGTQPRSYFLMPRSSIAKTPLMLANSIGLIDAGYRGQLMAAVRNMSNKPFMIQKGTSLFQVVDGAAKPMKVKVVNELDETSRGAGGFGSTGN